MITRHTEVLVVGAGLAGLMAAARAAEQNKRVMVAAKGWGAMGLSSGCIDLWGYKLDKPAEVAANPLEEIARLGRLRPEHPYSKVQDVIVESLDFFRRICLEQGNPYAGNNQGNWLLPTALGTLRPTYLAPHSMALEGWSKRNKILIVGFRELKDFYPEVLATNLRKTGILEADCEVSTTWVRLGEGELNPGTLAGQLEQPAKQACLVEQLKPLIMQGSTVLMPPVLGQRRNSTVAVELAQRLGCQVYEVTNIPPALPGQRLQQTLLQHLKSIGVEVVQGCTVKEAVLENKRCISVNVQAVNRQFQIQAKAFVLASGSLFGGGLVAAPAKISEAIFDLPVKTDAKWSDNDFLGLEGHGFNHFGLRVDQNLRPLDTEGRVALSNVFAAGAILAGADFAVEKCGNGVAVTTGFKAGKLAGESDHD